MKKHTKIVRDYNNLEQYNQFDNFDASLHYKKEDFFERLCNKVKIVETYLSNISFYNEFYVICLKTNSLKANRVYIYVNEEVENSYTVDFISEWNDKINHKVVRGIKKTIYNISLENLRIVLKSLN